MLSNLYLRFNPINLEISISRPAATASSGRSHSDFSLRGAVRLFTDGRQPAAVQQNLVVVLLEALPEVVGEVVLDVVSELVPEVRVEPEDLEQVGHLDALEEAVGQRLHVGAALDDGGGAGGDGNVAANQVTLPEQGDHHPLLDDLHGAAGEIEDVLHHVTAVDEVLVRGAE